MNIKRTTTQGESPNMTTSNNIFTRTVLTKLMYLYMAARYCNERRIYVILIVDIGESSNLTVQSSNK